MGRLAAGAAGARPWGRVHGAGPGPPLCPKDCLGPPVKWGMVHGGAGQPWSRGPWRKAGGKRPEGAAGKGEMSVDWIRTRRVIAGLLLAAMAAIAGLAGPAGGQEVSEQGNPWVRVSLGKITVEAEAVMTPERLYLGLSYRKELPEGRGMLFFMPETEV